MGSRSHVHHHPPCSHNLSLPLLFNHSTSTSKSNIVVSKYPKFRSVCIKVVDKITCLCFSESNNHHHGSIEEAWNPKKAGESEEVELLGKPSPLPQTPSSEVELAATQSPKPDKQQVLAPFLKFFTSKDNQIDEVNKLEEEEEVKERRVEYYEPKPGDFVVGVVVSGNAHKIDVNIGADLLATMLTKEVLPLYHKQQQQLPTVKDNQPPGNIYMMGIVLDQHDPLPLPPGTPVVDPGTILFAEVLGRTLSARPLLSSRRLFRRLAWHRLRQIKHLNHPIQVQITEWNTGGLLTRIEGLRAFLPKAELMNRVHNFTDLKQNVGRQLFVHISRIDEPNNDLILSEREAWDMMHLQEGTLLEGTVRKIFPYGAQVRIGDTNRSGLLHISNITRSRVDSVSDLLSVDEKVKVLVVKSMFPDKIALSIVDLESEPGLFVSNKEKVFSEAEEMAKRYRQKLPAVSATSKTNPLATEVTPFDDEEALYANWKWFKFDKLE